MDSGQIILFQTQGGETKVEVRLANESVWLTADRMAELSQPTFNQAMSMSKKSIRFFNTYSCKKMQDAKGENPHLQIKQSLCEDCADICFIGD